MGTLRAAIFTNPNNEKHLIGFKHSGLNRLLNMFQKKVPEKKGAFEVIFAFVLAVNSRLDSIAGSTKVQKSLQIFFSSGSF